MKEDLKNIIKQTADNHLDDINPDMIWSGIESKLGQKKKRRFAGYFIFGGLSLVAAMLIYAFVWSSEGAMEKSKFNNYVSEINLNSESTFGKEARNEEVINEIVVDIENEEIDKIQNIELIFDNQIVDDYEVGYDSKNEIVLVSMNLDKHKSGLDVFDKEIANIFVEPQAAEENSEAIIFNKTETRDLLVMPLVEQLYFDGLDINDRVIEIENYEEFVFDSPYEGDRSKISFMSGVEFYSGLSFGDKSVSDLNLAYSVARNSSEQLLEQCNT